MRIHQLIPPQKWHLSHINSFVSAYYSESILIQQRPESISNLRHVSINPRIQVQNYTNIMQFFHVFIKVFQVDPSTQPAPKKYLSSSTPLYQKTIPNQSDPAETPPNWIDSRFFSAKIKMGTSPSKPKPSQLGRILEPWCYYCRKAWYTLLYLTA